MTKLLRNLQSKNILKLAQCNYDDWSNINAILEGLRNSFIKGYKANPLHNVNSNAGVKWVKASERLPEFEKDIPIKLEGKNTLGRFYELMESKRCRIEDSTVLMDLVKKIILNIEQ